MADEFLWDMLIISIRDKNHEMQFYSKHDMTMNKVINQVKVVEITEWQLNVITPSDSDRWIIIFQAYNTKTRNKNVVPVLVTIIA
jgi:hypothetical protein